MKRLFAKKGHSVLTASRVSKAFEKLEAQNIHVVVLDVKMPGVNGVEVLKKIKKRFPLAQVIMLTGHGEVDTAADSLKFGAINYLIKPIDIEELLQKTEEAFEKRQRLEKKIRKTQIKVLEHQF